jgi:acyltransferase family protein (fragment)
LALIIVSALLAYSFNKMCNYCTNLLVADKRNDNAN